jgi:hypothetical protein
MLPLCREEKIGVIPYSPLASGRLTRDWSSETTARSETDQVAKGKYDASAETDQRVVARVAEIAEQRGVPRVHVALAEKLSPFWDRRIGYGLPNLKDKNLSVQLDTCAKCFMKFVDHGHL